MKKVFFLSAVICVFLSVAIRVSAEEKINLAVAEFEARNVSQMDAVTISDLFQADLVLINAFHILDRKYMDTILGDQRLHFSGCNNKVCAVEMGKLLNAHKIVIGAFSKLFDASYITISLVDVETSEIVYADVAKCISDQEIRKNIFALALKLSEKYGTGKMERTEKIELDYSGRVPCVSAIMKENEVVKINRGSYDNIKENNFFNLYYGDRVIARFKVTEVKDDESVAQVVKLEQGHKINPGMTVKYVGRFRKNGLGFLLGLSGGGSFSYSGPGVGFYYDFVSESGLGLQLNAAIWANSVYRDGPYGTEESILVNYFCPFFVKFYESVLSPIAPFFGLGVAYAHCEWDRRIRWPHEKDSSNFLVPVVNFGCKFFTANPVQFTLDWRYFFGRRYHGWDTKLQSFVGGISTYW